MAKRILGRIPLPRQQGGAHTTKKGKRGYDRKKEKQKIRKEACAIT